MVDCIIKDELQTTQYINMFLQVMPASFHHLNLPMTSTDLKHVEDYVFDHDAVSQCIETWKEIPIRPRQPSNNNEAVALAALEFKLDLSLTKRPLAEYEELRRSIGVGRYMPLDVELSRRLRMAEKNKY